LTVLAGELHGCPRHLPALPTVPFAAARSSGPLLVMHLNKQPVDLAVVNGLLSHHQPILL